MREILFENEIHSFCIWTLAFVALKLFYIIRSTHKMDTIIQCACKWLDKCMCVWGLHLNNFNWSEQTLTQQNDFHFICIKNRFSCAWLFFVFLCLKFFIDSSNWFNRLISKYWVHILHRCDLVDMGKCSNVKTILWYSNHSLCFFFRSVHNIFDMNQCDERFGRKICKKLNAEIVNE